MGAFRLRKARRPFMSVASGGLKGGRQASCNATKATSRARKGIPLFCSAKNAPQAFALECAANRIYGEKSTEDIYCSPHNGTVDRFVTSCDFHKK